MGLRQKIKIINLNNQDKEPLNKNKLKIIRETDHKIEDFEKNAFLEVISEELDSAQKEDLVIPPRTYPHEKNVLAIHWHPEFIPMDIIITRLKNTFPNAKNELIIPTQHNVLLSLNGYNGVEIDCFSPEFNRKIQLLLHFGKLDKNKSAKFRLIIEHTFKYRSKQLFELLDTLAMKSHNERVEKAIFKTGVNKNVVDFVRIQSQKLLKFLEDNILTVPPLSIKNKLVRNYMDELTDYFDKGLISIAQIFIKTVKEIVKEEFDNSYFYKTREIIEEARLLNAGIVVPHPEQFWPILLAGYDVDGYEVWNPQSREYTEFLMQVVLDQNKNKKLRDRSILVFMGDDTHMGEKARPEELRDPDKSAREVGVQPAWEEPDIQKILIKTGFSKEKIINEYRSRLK